MTGKAHWLSKFNATSNGINESRVYQYPTIGSFKGFLSIGADPDNIPPQAAPIPNEQVHVIGNVRGLNVKTEESFHFIKEATGTQPKTPITRSKIHYNPTNKTIEFHFYE